LKRNDREGDGVGLSNGDESGDDSEAERGVNGERGTEVGKRCWKEKGVCCGVEWMKAPRINGESESRGAGEVN